MDIIEKILSLLSSLIADPTYKYRTFVRSICSETNGRLVGSSYLKIKKAKHIEIIIVAVIVAVVVAQVDGLAMDIINMRRNCANT